MDEHIGRSAFAAPPILPKSRIGQAAQQTAVLIGATACNIPVLQIRDRDRQMKPGPKDSSCHQQARLAEEGVTIVVVNIGEQLQSKETIIARAQFPACSENLPGRPKPSLRIFGHTLPVHHLVPEDAGCHTCVDELQPAAVASRHSQS